MSDPIEDARRAADAARAGLRSYEDAVLEEAERALRLRDLNGAARVTNLADLERRFPAMKGRVAQ